MPFVYILQSTRDKRFYIGSTIDIDRRLIHHKKGLTPSTKRFGTIQLVFKQQYESLKEARYIEKRLKKLKRKDYIMKIIQDGYIKLRMR